MLRWRSMRSVGRRMRSGLGGRNNFLVGGGKASEPGGRGLRGCDLLQRGLREDFEQHALPFLPYPEHPAGRLQGARTRAVNAYVERDRTLDRLDHVLEGDSSGGAGELIAAAGTAARAHQPAMHQVANHLLKVVLGNLLAARDLGAARDALGMVGEVDHRPQRVFDLARYLHQAHDAAPALRRRGRTARRAGFAAAPPLRWGARMRSTYLTIMSASTLTAAPGPLRPSVVSFSVCGMSATSKRRPRMPNTVRLTPSIAAEPFSTR